MQSNWTAGLEKMGQMSRVAVLATLALASLGADAPGRPHQPPDEDTALGAWLEFPASWLRPGLLWSEISPLRLETPPALLSEDQNPRLIAPANGGPIGAVLSAWAASGDDGTAAKVPCAACGRTPTPARRAAAADAQEPSAAGEPTADVVSELMRIREQVGAVVDDSTFRSIVRGEGDRPEATVELFRRTWQRLSALPVQARVASSRAAPAPFRGADDRATIDLLREAARRVEQAADVLERQDLFAPADELRATAAQLRQAARERCR